MKRPFRDRITLFFDTNLGIILTGILFGLSAVLLQMLGNPKGTGLCIACFFRDSSGALGLDANNGYTVRLYNPGGGSNYLLEIINLPLASGIWDATDPVGYW